MKMWKVAAGVAAAGLVASAANASTLYSFGGLSNNDVNDTNIAEAQLFVDVSAFGADVLFTFINIGPLSTSITDVYFDDGSLLGLAGLIDADDNGGDAGVDFSPGASPPNLPSAQNASPPFVTTIGFLADSDPPPFFNGVNPGETLGVFFTILFGKTVADVNAELASGVLRIGIHVQGFTSGGSESLINCPDGDCVIIPLPSAAGMGLAGLAGLGFIRRRRN